MAFKLNFSTDYIAKNFRETLCRFPFVIMAAWTAGVLANILFKGNFKLPVMQLAWQSLMISIPTLIAAALYTERLGKNPWRASVVAMLLPLGYFISGWNIEATRITYLTFHLALAAHLLVAFLPFVKRDEKNGFWHFNQRLFLRFFLSGLYAGVLYCGLALIYVSLTYLFKIKIDSDFYQYTWFVCAFGFHPVHFLAGVPKNFEELNRDSTYPNGIRIFSQYLLVPLLSVYGAILLAYLLKILIAGSWPRGNVGWMVSSYAAVGIFTILLLSPLRQSVAWVARYTKVFYAALIPLSTLMLAGVIKRLGDYNFTESRYFLLVFALWSLGVAVYFLVSRRKNIFVIPASLFLVTLLSSVGPWSAYHVSQRLQAKRLTQLMQANDLLKDGKVQPPSKPLHLDAKNEIASIVEYLAARHGIASLPEWIDRSKFDPQERSSYKREHLAREQFFKQLQIVDGNTSSNSTQSFYLEHTWKSAVELRGFSKIGHLHSTRSRDDAQETWATIKDAVFEIYVWDKKVYSISESELASKYVDEEGNRLQKKGELPLRLEIRTSDFRGDLLILVLKGRTEKDQVTLTEVEGFLLY